MEWETIVVLAWVFLLVLTVRTIWDLQSAKHIISELIGIAHQQNDALDKLASIVKRIKEGE